MTQTHLPFPDPEEEKRGKERLEDALERVEENSGEAWKAIAWAAALDVVAEGHDFTSERIRQKLTQWGDWPPPNDPRALGPVMKRLLREGYIESTRRFTKSVYSSSSGTNKEIFRVIRRPATR